MSRPDGVTPQDVLQRLDRMPRWLRLLMWWGNLIDRLLEAGHG